MHENLQVLVQVLEAHWEMTPCKGSQHRCQKVALLVSILTLLAAVLPWASYWPRLPGLLLYIYIYIYTYIYIYMYETGTPVSRAGFRLARVWMQLRMTLNPFSYLYLPTATITDVSCLYRAGIWTQAFTGTGQACFPLSHIPTLTFYPSLLLSGQYISLSAALRT
jgi:hypothetical protein